MMLGNLSGCDLTGCELDGNNEIKNCKFPFENSFYDHLPSHFRISCKLSAFLSFQKTSVFAAKH